jgi:hypothetical protein
LGHDARLQWRTTRKAWRIGIGGTFTDVAMVEEASRHHLAADDSARFPPGGDRWHPTRIV